MKSIFVVVAIVLSHPISIETAQTRNAPQVVSQEEKDRLNTLMWNAIQRDSVKEIQDLFNAKIVPNSNIKKGIFTPLTFAVAFRSIPMLQALIAARADVNAPDTIGWTPLMYAAAQGKLVMVHVLLDANANVHLQTQEGSTALMIAAVTGKADVVRALIDADADINHKNKKGQTTLQLARESGHGPAIEAAMKEALAARAQRVKATEQQIMEHTGLIGDLAHIVAESVHGEGLKKE